MAKPDIEARMAEYEEGQIEFSILSLVKDPLLDLIPILAENIKSLIAVTSYIEGIASEIALGEDQRGFEVPGTLTSSDSAYGLTPGAIEQANVSSKVDSALQSQVLSDVIDCRRELLSSQAILRASIRNEYEAKHLEDQKANARRYDYGPLALKLAQVLARKPIAGFGKSSSKRKKQKG